MDNQQNNSMSYSLNSWNMLTIISAVKTSLLYVSARCGTILRMIILCLFFMSCGSNEGIPENPPKVNSDSKPIIQQPAETQNIQPNDNAAQVYKPIIGDTSVDIENMDYPMPSGRVISVLITGIECFS